MDGRRQDVEGRLCDVVDGSLDKVLAANDDIVLFESTKWDMYCRCGRIADDNSA